MIAKTSLGFLLTAVLLVVAASGKDWQGSGNMNNTVMTKIYAHIDPNLTKLFTNFTFANSFPKALSDVLNTEWHPAWNVVLAFGTKDYDTIVYGYAFNNHWMWFNGITNPTDATLILSFIIWKDYNCHNWKTFEEGVSSFTQQMKTSLAVEVS